MFTNSLMPTLSHREFLPTTRMLLHFKPVKFS